MAITVTEVKRHFTFNGADLMDPGPEFTPEEVRDMYSAQYPDITSSIIDGPEIKSDIAHYTFVRNVGSKG